MTTELNGTVEEAVAVKEKHWFAITRYKGAEWNALWNDNPRDRGKVLNNAESFSGAEIKLICVEL